MTLNETEKQFASWHKRKGRIPNSLKQAACDLLNKYPKPLVSERLRITIKTLSNWQDKVGTPVPVATDNSTNTFIPFESLSPQVSGQEEGLLTGLTLLLGNGMKILLPEQSIQKTCKLLRLLSEEFEACSI